MAMKDRLRFCVAGELAAPTTGEWTRTFAILTTEPNELCATIHDRMPVIIDPADYDRWLGSEADPRDLLQPYPAEKMGAWAIILIGAGGRTRTGTGKPPRDFRTCYGFRRPRLA